MVDREDKIINAESMTIRGVIKSKPKPSSRPYRLAQNVDRKIVRWLSTTE
jgi:hypothetical protein